MADTMYARTWTLEGIDILRSGDGRTVEAYATVFDVPTEIQDDHGHYEEVISKMAFNRTLAHGIGRVGVFYHHGMTLHGTPSDLGSVPLGSPLEILADGKGLRTVTRYNKSMLADSVLESIRNGDIRGYSFRGKIYKSDPARPPRMRPGGRLPRVVRNELGLTEYGPTPSPAYEGASILAVRSAEALMGRLTGLADDDRQELVRLLSSATPLDPETTTATPEGTGPGAEDSRDAHSGRQRLARIRAEMRFRGVLK